ncbi:endolytic transglycosylase MltG [Streptococcus sp. HMSC061D10]|uniref:endolytic transglycosylase MltG n=1 Tax=Streptococcus sp. HMSC061D10 TaxID=1715207 RepID=UPI0008C006A6|nr:endolytic transglycosylase MltG [Streptococcus sp. HMSC061D10]OFN82573.1 aminodeoxychorismate lyase [Streptococcus sp. HMSC061D10]
MSENSREEEKLSFKEQILRDLERLKREDGIANTKSSNDDLFSNLSNSSEAEKPVEEPSVEDLMANSVSLVDELLANAPAVPPRPVLQDDSVETSVASEPAVAPDPLPSTEPLSSTEPAEPVKPLEPTQPVEEEKDFNAVSTRIPVSYRTNQAKPSPARKNIKPQQKPTVLAKETPSQEPVAPVETGTELPRRSRKESVKPIKKKKKSRLKGFFVTVFVLLVLLGVGGFFGYRYVESALQPVDANSKQYVTVQIPEGANLQQIGDTLENSGLVKHGFIFSLYAKYKDYSDLKSGYYNLQKSMSTDDIIKELQKGGTPQPQEVALANLTIPEGYTLDQIAQTVGQLQGEFKEPLTADAFLAKVQDETFISQLVAKYPTLLESLPTKESGVRYRLEGYLFPATYAIKESTTIESLIDEMVAAMDKNLSAHYTAIKEKNLTVNELLTIASLVEKEGLKTDDRKLIAGVFYNRLNLGMPLQSNIAILYAEGKLGQNISLADDASIDTTINSPYNVYTNLGLMPGPVDSPSLDAIEASINQTKSDYLYFVANVQDGKVYFATTREEHDRNVAEHVNSKLTQSSSSN